MQSSTAISQPWRPLLKKILGSSFGKSLAGLALATSIVGYGISGIPVLDGSMGAISLQEGYVNASTPSLQMQTHPQQSMHSALHPTVSPLPAHSNVGSLLVQSTIPFLGNGTYLYGQVTEPNKAGSVYMVFDVRGQDIVGAFYMPNSSFDCFQGTIRSDELALTVHDSYLQDTFAFAVALVPNDEAIAFNGAVVAPNLEIDGFQPLEAIDDNEQRILSTCRADLL